MITGERWFAVSYNTVTVQDLPLKPHSQAT